MLGFLGKVGPSLPAGQKDLAKTEDVVENTIPEFAVDKPPQSISPPGLIDGFYSVD